MTTRKMKHRKLKGGLPTIINDGNIFKFVQYYIDDNPKLPEDLRDTPIGEWDVSRVTNMEGLFSFNAGLFNEPIGGWDVSNVTCMFCLFNEAHSFNQPIGGWNVSNVTDMKEMFSYATSFNQPIGDWNVSNVTDMQEMFSHATSFNQPIGGWDVSKVRHMTGMFQNAGEFDQPIGDWNVSNVTRMFSMFKDAIGFNQPIGGWDVSNVRHMPRMFQGAVSFNQPIGNWKVSPFADVGHMFEGAVSFTGTKSVNQPILCGDKSLFQTYFRIEDWTPLECSVDNPKNCGPTALKIVFPEMDAPFQALSDEVERTGIKIARFNKFFYDLVRHLDLEYTVLSVRELLPNLLNFFRTNLLPGYVTVIWLANPVDGGTDHVTTILRMNDQLVLFDGQTNRRYIDGAIVNYVRVYGNIYLWCNKHKNKHRFKPMIEESESESQSSKKQRQGGKTRRKTRRSYV